METSNTCVLQICARDRLTDHSDLEELRALIVFVLKIFAPMENLANFTGPNNGVNVGHNLGNISINFNNLTGGDLAQKYENALHVTDARVDRESIISTKGPIVSGTCNWIDQHPAFRVWYDSISSSLCIVGGPGKGKIMLAVYITTTLERAHDHSDLSLTYFFCDHRNSNRNSACAVLRTLLTQIIHQRPSLAKNAERCLGGNARENECAERVLTCRDDLWLMLYDMLKRPELQCFVCVIDGLDECDDASSS